MKQTIALINLIFICSQMLIFSQTQNFEINAAVGLTFTPAAEDINTISISPLLNIKYNLSEDYFIGAKLGASFVKLNRKNYNIESSFDVANIILGGGIKNLRVYDNIKTDVLLNVGVPLATFPGNIPSNRLTEFNYNNANSSYGWSEPFVWLMNVVPITIETNTNFELNKKLCFLLKVEPGYLIAINSRPSGSVVATKLEAKYNFGKVNFRLGWRTYLTSISIENNNYDQNSISVGLDYKLLQNEFKTDFNLNIDYPNGITERTPKPFWGLVFSYEY
jgi:hypothetical protein